VSSGPRRPDPQRPPELAWPDWPGWPFVLLGLGLLAIALSAWRPIPAGVWHDDGVYMLLGKALGEGEGLRYVGVVGAPPAPKFPPVYPTLLGLLWFTLGSLGPVTLVAELVNLALISTAGALMAWGLHIHGGLPRGAAVVAALLAFSSADVLRSSLIPLSEPLFLALLMGALAAWEVGRAEKGRGPWLLAGLLVIVALTRTAGTAAVAGIGLALLLRSGLRRSLMVLAPSILAMAAWGLWAGRRATEIPEALRDVLGPYLGWLAGQILASPVAFMARLPAHMGDIGVRVAALLLPGLQGGWMWLAALPLAVLAVVGALRLHRRFPPFVWTAVAYLGLLIVWPYVDRRLVVPLHPFLVAMVVAGAVEVGDRWSGRRAARLVVGAALVWMGGYAVMTTGRIARGWPAAAYRIRADALATGVEALGRMAPPGSVVGAPELWAALSLHGGWTVVPSARFAPAATTEDRPVWGTPEEQLELWRSAGVDHLLLEQGGQIHGDALTLQEDRCPGSVIILARMPPQMLVRVRWELCGAGAP